MPIGKVEGVFRSLVRNSYKLATSAHCDHIIGIDFGKKVEEESSTCKMIIQLLLDLNVLFFYYIKYC